MNNKLAFINEKVEEILSLVLYGYIVAIIFIEVLCRYLLDNSIIWAEETARYAFIWLTYISMASVARGRGHLAFTMIRDMLPRSIQLPLLLISDALLIGLSTVVVIYAYQSVSMNIEFQQQMTSAALPLWLATASVSVGWSLVFLRTMQRAWGAIIKFRAGEPLITSAPDQV